MLGYLVSLLMGLAVGAAYGLVQVRSPALPMIALVGLFGSRRSTWRSAISRRRLRLLSSTMQTAPKALRGSANRNDWCIALQFYRNYLLALDHLGSEYCP